MSYDYNLGHWADQLHLDSVDIIALTEAYFEGLSETVGSPPTDADIAEGALGDHFGEMMDDIMDYNNDDDDD